MADSNNNLVNNVVKSAGDVDLKEVTIITKDGTEFSLLGGYIGELNLFEDMKKTVIGQDDAVKQQQAQSASQQHGGEGTANPSPAVNPANESSDPLNFLRSLAGLRK